MRGLDVAAGIFCFIMAASCIVLHILTTPKHKVWLNLPEYVRVGIFFTACLMIYRGMNLVGLSTKPESFGHANVESLLSLVFVTYTITAIAAHVLSRTYPARLWDRMRFFESVMKCRGARKDALAAGVVAEIAADSHGGFVAPPGGDQPIG